MPLQAQRELTVTLNRVARYRVKPIFDGRSRLAHGAG